MSAFFSESSSVEILFPRTNNVPLFKKSPEAVNFLVKVKLPPNSTSTLAKDSFANNCKCVFCPESLSAKTTKLDVDLKSFPASPSLLKVDNVPPATYTSSKLFCPVMNKVPLYFEPLESPTTNRLRLPLGLAQTPESVAFDVR